MCDQPPKDVIFGGKYEKKNFLERASSREKNKPPSAFHPFEPSVVSVQFPEKKVMVVR